MKGYISDLYKSQTKESKDIGVVANMILRSFTKRKTSSTYQCYKDLNEIYEQDDKSITYKNVYQRVQRLYVTRLIEKVKKDKENTTKHGAIYYKLTSLGIFHLIIRKSHYLDKNIFLNYKNNGLFIFFLYPYIKQANIEKLVDLNLIRYIVAFLSNCCFEIDDYFLRRIKELEKDGGFNYAITTTSSIVDPKCNDDWYTGSKEFIRYLKERFNIKWLDIDTTKIIEIEKNSLIKIIDGKNELCLKINENEKEARLSEDQIEIVRFNLKNIDKITYAINEFRPMTVEEYLSSDIPAFHHEIQKHLTEFCLKVLQYNMLSSYNKKEEYDKLHDMRILSKDDHFMNVVNKWKNNNDLCYSEIVSLSQQN